ncbi:MAG TPA: thioredoxin family protein [Pyrinomonadaceae bacterium]|jgi:thioredoxin-like negative regulator of GroEL
MPEEIKSVEDFNSFIRAKGVVIIHFWAEWNRLDNEMKEILKELEFEFGRKVKFYSLDVDQPHLFDLLRNLRLSGVTALAYFKDGNKIALEVSLKNKEYVQNKINQLLNS